MSWDRQVFDSIMAEYKSLATYASVVPWDQRALVEVNRIVGVIKGLDDEILKKTKAHQQATRERMQKSFLARLLASRKKENDFADGISQCNQLRVSLIELAIRLQDAVGIAPRSPDEQKALLKELRLRKKELQLQKREITTTMKSIREEARVKSVHANVEFLGVYDSLCSASERRRIRYARESALEPYEGTNESLERQILQVDKDILWVEHFMQ
jgi:hypothetical protein